ncbi:MAG: type IV pilus twitching motility protein PilT [Candidatus Cloacimonetes bacterium]|nr:type IV pilus twitching motility protein PilT [Candidatus Cloacimonadota bacterium]
MFKILGRAQAKGASDIILSVGLPPMIRVSGSLVRDQFPVLNPDMIKKLVYSFLRQDQIAIFEQSFELDMALSVPGIARYRVNVFRQKKCVGAAFRSITETIPSFEELGLPKPIETMALLPRGLVLVTGPTGSGKSSTLAAMLDLINQRKNGHIITIEDPIEYVHRHKNCVVEQRELKTDTESFTIALRQSLRQNPDTILVGEMRDLETISAAISAAETGHLVMSTLHTQDAAQTVDRIIDVFPSHQQEQVRAQLSTTLRGIVSQQLLPRKNGGRVAAREILLVTSAIANLIREGKSYQINSAIQTGAKLGMVSMDMSLMELYQKGLVTYEDAVSKAIYPENIKPNF